ADRQADENRKIARAARRNLYASDMNLVQREWESGSLGRVIQLLREHQPKSEEEDLRGWEWYYQRRLCHADVRMLKGNFTRFVKVPVAISPDGQRLAAGIAGGVKVWDLVTGQQVRTLKRHTHLVRSVAATWDGKRLLLASAS